MLFRAGKCLAVRMEVFRRPVLYFLLNCGNAIAGIGVVAHELRAATPTLLFELLEKRRQRFRIVTRLVHDNGAYGVSLRFIAPRIFQR